MQKLLILISGISGAIAVTLGALGAHALKSKITPDQLHSFETGSKYHFYHTIALLLLALLIGKFNVKMLHYSAWFFMAGILLFSGSIYLLATKDLLGIQGWTWLGPVTPIGGLCFIAGWLLLFFSAFKIHN